MCAAKKRGIDFLLTFDQWLSWWQDTGKLELRGKRRGEYQMCRIGDTGPYSIENIYCDTVSNNSGLTNLGRPRNQASIEKMLATKVANGYVYDPFIEARKRIQDESAAKAMAAIQWAYETRSARRHALKKFSVSQRVWERCIVDWESANGVQYDVPKRAIGDAAGGKKNGKTVICPLGVFPSAKAASIATGIGHSTIVYRCMNNSNGWSYAQHI